MKSFRLITLFLLISVVMTSFSQCSSSKNLDRKPPMEFGKVYSQSWTAGIEGGGSGFNIFIPVKENAILLDSVYYKGRSAKLETKPGNEDLYIGRFTNKTNGPQDLILSSDPKEEAKNKLPEIPKKVSFELENDECVVTYKKEGQTHYFKISDVETKPRANYPSSPPNRQ